MVRTLYYTPPSSPPTRTCRPPLYADNQREITTFPCSPQLLLHIQCQWYYLLSDVTSDAIPVTKCPWSQWSQCCSPLSPVAGARRLPSRLHRPPPRRPRRNSFRTWPSASRMGSRWPLAIAATCTWQSSYRYRPAAKFSFVLLWSFFLIVFAKIQIIDEIREKFSKYKNYSQLRFLPIFPGFYNDGYVLSYLLYRSSRGGTSNRDSGPRRTTCWPAY